MINLDILIQQIEATVSNSIENVELCTPSDAKILINKLSTFNDDLIEIIGNLKVEKPNIKEKHHKIKDLKKLISYYYILLNYSSEITLVQQSELQYHMLVMKSCITELIVIADE